MSTPNDSPDPHKVAEALRGFVFNPKRNIDGEGSNTNGQRATRAKYTLARYKDKLSEAGPICADTVMDLIADLGHFCDREGFDYNECVLEANNRWEEER